MVQILPSPPFLGSFLWWRGLGTASSSQMLAPLTSAFSTTNFAKTFSSHFHLFHISSLGTLAVVLSYPLFLVLSFTLLITFHFISARPYWLRRMAMSHKSLKTNKYYHQKDNLWRVLFSYAFLLAMCSWSIAIIIWKNSYLIITSSIIAGDGTSARHKHGFHNLNSYFRVSHVFVFNQR